MATLIRSLQDWRRRRILRRTRLAPAEWHKVIGALPVLRGLSPEESERLRELTVLFLHEKSLEPAGGLMLTDAMKWAIAAQACLPILNLGLRFYRGWVSVIVYPAGFWVPQQRVDAAGVVHSERHARTGEAWDRGPLILSWADVAEAGAGGGSNVVIHEFAHKLDMLNGAANGMPPLHREMAPARWTGVFTATYEDFCRRLRLGLDIPLDPYAAESPAEFFAVASEAFFAIPGVLKESYPAVYEQLRVFYRQDPALRLAD